MKSYLPLFIMIDACGWEIVKNSPFLSALAGSRKRVRSVFGYSSACIPSILSGRWPESHRNWCYFVYNPKDSPFKALKPLSLLPKALTSRRIVRRLLTRTVKKSLGFKGYFDLYNIPFQHIHLFDFTEKKSPLEPGGMNRGTNIFDYLTEQGIPYFGSSPNKSEEENYQDLLGELDRGEVDFAFSYWPALDGLLHMVGNKSPKVPEKLEHYENWISKVYEGAKQSYKTVDLFVFSDHGMANCETHFDLAAHLEPLKLKFGTDFVAVYDSTMARFWFLNPAAKEKITQQLTGNPHGRFMEKEELKELKTYFPDDSFGEAFFLLKEGVLLVPSHMGERPITAMHGYHPDDKHSYACLFTNNPNVIEQVTDIPHIYHLMVSQASKALKENAVSKNETALA